jgi:hypothetical protein
MKQQDRLKQLEQQAADHLVHLLREVPFLHVGEAEIEPLLGPHLNVDFLLRVEANNQPHRLVCEVKSQAQPRTVRDAATQLRFYCDQLGRDAYGVFLAPYLSPASQEICKDLGVGFADLQGNCRLVFNGAFIERLVATRPEAERRDLRSVFAPKSAQVLKVLMRDPGRRWKVTDLAEAAGVSLGHVSNVRNAIIEREWARADTDGLHITKPDLLLETWREAYRRQGKRHSYYTTLHGKALHEITRGALRHANVVGAAMLGSFSAAQWLAPYARTSTEFFYVDRPGLAALESELQLESTAKGENVVVMELDDDGLFRDAEEAAPGIRCTGALQTYLDLWISGDRGREAAEHLRTEKLPWTR